MKKLISMVDKCELSTREYIGAGVILFLVGIILGSFFSPKGNRAYGSNNGNNNTGCLAENDIKPLEEDEE